MIHGGICHYPAGSQLAQAAKFLRAHRGRTALITIDIGANDPNSCVSTAAALTALLPCVVTRLPQIGDNLDRILTTLRAAAGKRVLIVGMTYYVPELGLWQRGTAGRQIGILTGAVAAGGNKMLADRYRATARGWRTCSRRSAAPTSARRTGTRTPRRLPRPASPAR